MHSTPLDNGGVQSSRPPNATNSTQQFVNKYNFIRHRQPQNIKQL